MCGIRDENSFGDRDAPISMVAMGIVLKLMVSNKGALSRYLVLF